MDSVIEDVQVRKILDSKGNATIEIDVITWNGFGRASAPNGSNTNSKEVVAFPQGGVDIVVREMEDLIASELIGMDACDITTIDEILHEIDATSDLSSIGGNTIVAISMAAVKAAASSYNLPLYKFIGGNFINQLPYPLSTIMKGRSYEELLVVPIGAKNIVDGIFANASIYKKFKNLIHSKNPLNLHNVDVLEIQTQVCEEVSDELGIEIKPALDIAASNIWDGYEQKYIYDADNIKRDKGEQLEFITDIIDTYNMFYVEDPFVESDFDSFSQLTSKVKNKCLICGDDLFTTNKELLKKGIEMEAANAIIIKPNQIGSLCETYATVKLAKENNIVPVISNRSGETTDETIAHLSVAFSSPLIKTDIVGDGGNSKLNELIRIEEELPNSQMGKL